MSIIEMLVISAPGACNTQTPASWPAAVVAASMAALAVSSSKAPQQQRRMPKLSQQPNKSHQCLSLLLLVLPGLAFVLCPFQSSHALAVIFLQSRQGRGTGTQHAATWLHSQQHLCKNAMHSACMCSQEKCRVCAVRSSSCRSSADSLPAPVLHKVHSLRSCAPCVQGTCCLAFCSTANFAIGNEVFALSRSMPPSYPCCWLAWVGALSAFHHASSIAGRMQYPRSCLISTWQPAW